MKEQASTSELESAISQAKKYKLQLLELHTRETGFEGGWNELEQLYEDTQANYIHQGLTVNVQAAVTVIAELLLADEDGDCLKAYVTAIHSFTKL